MAGQAFRPVGQAVMRIRRAYFPVLAVLLLTGTAAGGDLLILDTGERLSGRVARVRTGALLFHTTLEGQMMVPMDTVAGLVSEKNFVITLPGDATRYGRFLFRDGEQYLVPLKDGEPEPLSLAEIQEAVPIPQPPKGEAGEGEAAWSVSASAGAQYRAGNRDHIDAVTRLQVDRDAPRTEFEGRATIERDDRAYFPGYVRGEARLGSTGQPGVFGSVEAGRNIDAALDLRTGLNLGLTYDFGGHGLRGGAALNLAHEQWDVSTLRRRLHQWRPFEDSRKDETELNLRLGLRYSRVLFGDGAFESGIRLYPSLTGIGELRARSEAAVLVPVTTRLKLRFNVLVDYDNEPQFHGLDHWSTSVGAGIHLDF